VYTLGAAFKHLESNISPQDWQRSETTRIEDVRKAALEIEVQLAAREVTSALNTVNTHHMLQEIRDWNEKNAKRLESLDAEETELSRKNFEAIASWLEYKESEQREIIDSISDEVRKYPETCAWSTQHPKAKSWLNPNVDAPNLYLRGIKGSGKSYICARTVDFLVAGGKHVIYHFCSYSWASSLSYDKILRSLLMQLISRSRDIIKHVHDNYTNAIRSLRTAALEKLLGDVLKMSSPGARNQEYIWIVIDGLGECHEDTQARVTKLMSQITSNSTIPGSTIYKTLISFQFAPPSLKHIKKENTIFFSDEKLHIESSIRQYAQFRLELFTRLAARREIEDIAQDVAVKSSGMFLYARLVLDYLGSNIFYSSEEVKTSLNRLPEQLEELYEEMLAGILSRQDIRSFTRMRCLFGWVAYQKRPLRRLELLSAMTFSEYNPGGEKLARDYALDVCKPFLEERKDTSIAFIHSSVKSFFERPKVDYRLKNVQCWRSIELYRIDVFLRERSQQERAYRVLQGQHGLHLYATEHWTDYLLFRAEAENGFTIDLSVLALACNLAQRLDETEGPPVEKSSGNNARLDPRLRYLSGYPSLSKHVENFLRARSLETLESRLRKFEDTIDNQLTQQNDPVTCRITLMLTAYENTVRYLLDQHDFPGISSEAPRAFKSQLGISAFTCRVKECPKATIGFASKKCLLEHELSHLVRFPCTSEECKHILPFWSRDALKRHARTEHSPQRPRRVRRQVAHTNFNDHSNGIVVS
ncbi:unnamed protein product, partial [Colletotrichum noveboracense]